MLDLKKQIAIYLSAAALLILTVSPSFANYNGGQDNRHGGFSNNGEHRVEINMPNVHEIKHEIMTKVHERLSNMGGPDFSNHKVHINFMHHSHNSNFDKNHEFKKGFDSQKELDTSLNGHEEVPGPGDPDGWGHAKLVLDFKLYEIKNIPSEFYINVHNASYPDGAVRGQL
jgi:hypothetical protein